MTRQWNIHRVREWYFELTYNTVFDQDKGDSYYEYIRKILDVYKSEGFDRINPPVLKAAVLDVYPDFSERQIGFRRFSDVLRELERAKLLKVEMAEGGNMLVRIE